MAHIFYADCAIFIFIFLLLLLANFTERSITFNIIVSAGFLAKSLIGARYRKRTSFSLLREYVIQRLLMDCVIILPLVAIFAVYS